MILTIQNRFCLPLLGLGLWKPWVRSKLLAYVWFLQKRRQWKKGFFIVLILIFWQENKEGKPLRDLMAERSLCLSHTPESFSRRIQHMVSLKTFLQHAPLLFLPVVSGTSIYFHFLGIVVSKTQFLFIRVQRIAVLIRVTVDWSPWPSPHHCLILDKLCYSRTHDNFRPLLYYYLS